MYLLITEDRLAQQRFGKFEYTLPPWSRHCRISVLADIHNDGNHPLESGSSVRYRRWRTMAAHTLTTALGVQ